MIAKKFSELTAKEYNTFTGRVIYPNGNKECLLNGQYHREDGPAYEYANGYEVWYIHGKRHRLDGPAVNFYNGDKEWWVNDVYVGVKSQEEFESWLKTVAEIMK